jgi:hypothetical protein
MQVQRRICAMVTKFDASDDASFIWLHVELNVAQHSVHMYGSTRNTM